MLSVRCLSVLSVLSVTFVHCGQTVGRIKMKLGMQVGLGPGHCVRWGSSSPSPKGGRSPPIFGPYLLQPNGWMDQMPLGVEVGLSPGDFVLNGDPALPSPNMGQSPLSKFRPISILVKRLQYRCLHQDATWYGGRPQPRGLCVSPLPKFSAHVYYSYCDFVRTLHNAQSLLVYSSSSSSFIFYAFYF